MPSNLISLLHPRETLLPIQSTIIALARPVLAEIRHSNEHSLHMNAFGSPNSNGSSTEGRCVLWLHRIGLGLLLIAWSGCASPTYQYGLKHRVDPRPTLDMVNTITIGGEHPKLDRVEKAIHYPLQKIKSWFAKRDQSPPDPVELRRAVVYKAQEFLILNELVDIKIDVGEYDPAEQWRRLKANDRIHPFWKYSFGTVEHLKYAWIPGRVFHYDKYNPYTNTLSIHSTRPSMAVYESAEAKIIRDHRFPGAYLAVCSLPIAPLFKDVRVANDVLSYARTRQEWDLERELYPQIYSAYGSDLVSQAAWVFPSAWVLPSYYKPLLSIAGGAAGNVGGHIVVREREFERKLLGLASPTASVR